jgi:hypothetical protein
MMRFVLIMIGALIAIAVLRGSMGLLTRAFQQVMNPPAPPTDPNTVEMVKCPSCGSVFAPHQHVKKS